MLAMPIQAHDPSIRAGTELRRRLEHLACLIITRDLVCLQLIEPDREEVRCADPVVVSALEGPSVWPVVLRIVSSPPPSDMEFSTVRSARGVDRDEGFSDWIKNGHAAVWQVCIGPALRRGASLWLPSRGRIRTWSER
jgi:hypothetical protein